MNLGARFTIKIPNKTEPLFMRFTTSLFFFLFLVSKLRLHSADFNLQDIGKCGSQSALFEFEYKNSV